MAIFDDTTHLMPPSIQREPHEYRPMHNVPYLA